MKTVALVPIKLNNERIPGKNIRKFDDGTPLIKLMLKTLKNVKEIDEVYVFCSKEDIKEYLIDDVKFLKRDPSLDTPQALSHDLIGGFMNCVDADTYILAHVTSPFIKSSTIAKLVTEVNAGNYDSAFTAKKVKEFLWENGKPLNFDPTNIPRTQDLPLIYSEVTACYVFRKEVFQQYRRRVGLNPFIYDVDAVEALDIDYPEDFDIANAVYMSMVKNTMNN
jgi:CMP-N-acetylneuraminic acid synthetase